MRASLTLGAALAERLEMPFLELDRLIEQESGLTLSLIFEFHGQSGFRRLERQCLEDAIQRHPCFVMATGGSLISKPGTFERLLSSCFTAWLKTSPEEHMERVIAQGEMRPISEQATPCPTSNESFPSVTRCTLRLTFRSTLRDALSKKVSRS